jgi:hypothetical protein
MEAHNLKDAADSDGADSAESRREPERSRVSLSLSGGLGARAARARMRRTCRHTHHMTMMASSCARHGRGFFH